MLHALDGACRVTGNRVHRRAVLTKSLQTDAFLDWHFFGLLGEIADDQIVALVCPRPLLIELGERDELFPVGGACAAS